MFDSLLVANRGEIACRIFKTARKMGIRTIAVYSDADRDALHVRMADWAVHIGGASARDSYLRTDRILRAALDTDAAAIHPGYGFLSEQPDLVEGCAESGLIWVGPKLEAINSMGSKIEAKAIAKAAGVACIPGYAGADQSDETLAAAAIEIGLPVMIKASAGGGGKGMRAIHRQSDLKDAIRAARTEADRSFGDDRLLVEKLIENPRHIEVQLLGDQHGHLVHLFERDCSVQRNHQKLLEEAPAPNLRPETRERIHRQALSLGRHIGYDSAGTVEFIMDATSEEFFFLEMNTRLQVEHTVTEEVTGLDLVELQLRMAAGEVLPLAQDQITCNGHAIEARLTVEDAANGFRPGTGKILHCQVGSDLRCDSGVSAGSTVGTAYDSMIAKIIAHAPDRSSACRKLANGLENTEVSGLLTNRLFLRDALLRPSFLQGRATTDFLTQEWPEGWQPPFANTLLYAAVARHLRPMSSRTPWHALGGFRLLDSAGCSAKAIYADVNDPDTQITLTGQMGSLLVTAGTESFEIAARWRDDNTLEITRRGVTDIVGVRFHSDEISLYGRNFDAVHTVLPLADLNPSHGSETATSPDRITAPMPGLVVELRAKAGDPVAEGDTIVVMESMKLLMELKAAATGTLSAVRQQPGDTVEAGTLLAQLTLDT